MGKARGNLPVILDPRVWNRVDESTEAYFQQKKLGKGGGKMPLPAATDIVKLRNDTESNLLRGAALQISSNLLTGLTELSADYPWFSGALATADNKPFGILLQPATTGTIRECQVSGRVIARVNVTDANHTRCYLKSGETNLESSNDGSVQILYKPTGTGVIECVVLLHNPAASGGSPKIVELSSGTVVGSNKSTQALTSATFYEQELDGSSRMGDTGISHTAYWMSSWQGVESSKGILCEDNNGIKFVVPIWGFISSPGSGTRVYHPHATLLTSGASNVTSTPAEWDYAVSEDWGDVVSIGTSGDAGRMLINRIGKYKITHTIDLTRTSGTGFDTVTFNFFALQDQYFTFHESGERQTFTIMEMYTTSADDAKIYFSPSCTSGSEYDLVCSCLVEPLFD